MSSGCRDSAGLSRVGTLASRNGPVTSKLPDWSTMSDSPKRRVGVMVVWAWAMLLALAVVWAVVAVGVATEVFFLALLPTVMGALLRTKVPDNPIWLVFIFAGTGTLVASTVSGLLDPALPQTRASWITPPSGSRGGCLR